MLSSVGQLKRIAEASLLEEDEAQVMATVRPHL